MGFRMKEIKKFLEGESPTLSLNFIHLLRFALFLFRFNYFISTRLLHFNTIDAPVFKSSYLWKEYQNALLCKKKPFPSSCYSVICQP